jgi:hypothetical protein
VLQVGETEILEEEEEDTDWFLGYLVTLFFIQRLYNVEWGQMKPMNGN